MDKNQFMQLSLTEQAKKIGEQKNLTFDEYYTFVLLNGGLKFYIKGDYAKELKEKAQLYFLYEKEINLIRLIDVKKKNNKARILSVNVSRIIAVGTISFNMTLDGYESFHGDYIYQMIND